MSWNLCADLGNVPRHYQEYRHIIIVPYEEEFLQKGICRQVSLHLQQKAANTTSLTELVFVVAFLPRGTLQVLLAIRSKFYSSHINVKVQALTFATGFNSVLNVIVRNFSLLLQTCNAFRCRFVRVPYLRAVTYGNGTSLIIR